MFDMGLEAILFPSFDGISVVACGAFANTVYASSLFFFLFFFKFHSHCRCLFVLALPMMSLHRICAAHLADDDKCVIKYDYIKQSWNADEIKMWVRKIICRSSRIDLSPRSCLFILVYHRCVGKQCQNPNHNRFDVYYNLNEPGILLWKANFS